MFSCSLPRLGIQGAFEGQLNPHMWVLLHDKAKTLDLAGKPCACIGLGDHRYFYTARAADHLEHYVEAHDGRLIVPTLKIVEEHFGQEEAVRVWGKRLVDVLKPADRCQATPRISLKMVGASGQGVNSIGAIIAKGLKRSGYCVFGYREYPSLIKGGHASYQLDVSNQRVQSTDTEVNVLVALNHHGLELNMEELKPEGVLLHVTPGWQFPEHHQKLIEERRLRVICFPIDAVLSRLGAKAILSNVLLTAFLWAMFGLDVETLKSLVGEKFAKKKALLELNMRCVDEWYAFLDPQAGKIAVQLPAPNNDFSTHLLITGSQAMGLGTVHAGVRIYAGYPLTPSSPLLSFIADLENRTHMVVKQAEDEITAAQFVSGAMYMGTRALTATSGAGFDLMSETVSLNAMIENPTVFVLAQRPGPATGLPTWTAQGALLQAVNSGHGEFARCVLSVSTSQDAFDLMPIAFNLAEQFQISVIVLTEEQIPEALYTQEPYDLQKAEIQRGKLVTSHENLKALKSS